MIYVVHLHPSFNCPSTTAKHINNIIDFEPLLNEIQLFPFDQHQRSSPSSYHPVFSVSNDCSSQTPQGIYRTSQCQLDPLQKCSTATTAIIGIKDLPSYHLHNLHTLLLHSKQLGERNRKKNLSHSPVFTRNKCTECLRMKKRTQPGQPARARAVAILKLRSQNCLVYTTVTSNLYYTYMQCIRQ